MKLLRRLLEPKPLQRVTWVEPTALAGMLRGSSPPVVIDVRDTAEFDGPLGHIDNARNIPMSQLHGKLPEIVQAGRPVVFVCHTDRRSSAAADHLLRAGNPQVSVLRSGMVAWRSVA